MENTVFSDNSASAVAYASNGTSQGAAFIIDNTAATEVRLQEVSQGLWLWLLLKVISTIMDRYHIIVS